MGDQGPLNVAPRGSRITRRRFGAGAAGAGLTGILGGVFAPTANAVDDDFPDPRGLPGTFALLSHGAAARGATVQTTLGDGHHIGLFVGRQLASIETHPIGLVPLGYHAAGSHHLPWDLIVGGSRLTTGSYLVLLEVFTPDGHPSGIPPTSTYAFLTIDANDRTSVRMVALRSLL
jgi:hypothetical protein